MGCDIHVYMEVSERPWVDGEPRWGCLIRRPYIGRDYRLFSALAGVRQYEGFPAAVIQPRGIPRDIDRLRTLGEWTLFVTEGNDDAEGYCSPASAEKYLKYGSEWWDDDKRRITHPDWHTPSWVTATELRAAMAAAESLDHSEMSMVLACMEAIDRLGRTTRLVFWFDN